MDSETPRVELPRSSGSDGVRLAAFVGCTAGVFGALVALTYYVPWLREGQIRQPVVVVLSVGMLLGCSIFAWRILRPTVRIGRVCLADWDVTLTLFVLVVAGIWIINPGLFDWRVAVVLGGGTIGAIVLPRIRIPREARVPFGFVVAVAGGYFAVHSWIGAAGLAALLTVILIVDEWRHRRAKRSQRPREH